MLDELHGAYVFFKIDLKMVIIKLGLQKGMSGKWLSKLFGLYEWLVMPFGLINSPSTFIHSMNQVLRHFIGKFVVVYFYDILVYSLNMHDHFEHLKNVLHVLKEDKKYDNLEKCNFFQSEVTLLEFVVSAQGVNVNEENIKVIKYWPTPKCISDVRSFHDLDSFYKHFMPNFSTFPSLLNEIVKKNVAFKWEQAQEDEFCTLQETLMNSPILAFPNFAKTFEIECDAANVGAWAILLQEAHPKCIFLWEIEWSTLELLHLW